MQANLRVVLFDKLIDDDMLYRRILSQPFAAYSSLYLFDFLSFHTSNNEIFVKDFV